MEFELSPEGYADIVESIRQNNDDFYNYLNSEDFLKNKTEHPIVTLYKEQDLSFIRENEEFDSDERLDFTDIDIIAEMSQFKIIVKYILEFFGITEKDLIEIIKIDSVCIFEFMLEHCVTDELSNLFLKAIRDCVDLIENDENSGIMKFELSDLQKYADRFFEHFGVNTDENLAIMISSNFFSAYCELIDFSEILESKKSNETTDLESLFYSRGTDDFISFFEEKLEEN